MSMRYAVLADIASRAIRDDKKDSGWLRRPEDLVHRIVGWHAEADCTCGDEQCDRAGLTSVYPMLIDASNGATGHTHSPGWVAYGPCTIHTSYADAMRVAKSEYMRCKKEHDEIRNLERAMYGPEA